MSKVCANCKWHYRPSKDSHPKLCQDCARTINETAEYLGLKPREPKVSIQTIMRHKYWALKMKWAIEDGDRRDEVG